MTSIFYFFYYMGRYNYSATIPFIQAEFNLSGAQVGLMATVLTAGYAVGQFVNGVLIDRYGPRKMMTLGGILSPLMNLGVSISTTFTGILTFWSMNGYVQAMGYGSCCKLYANWFKPDGRGKPLGFNEFLQSFSSMIIVPLGALLITLYGWRSVYTFPVIPMFLMSFVFYWVIRNRPGEKRIQAGFIPVHKWTENEGIWSEIGWKEHYKAALSDWRMVASYVSYGGSQFGRFAIYTWVPAYIYSLTGNIITGGLVTAAFALGGSFGSLFVGWLSDVFKKRWPVIFVGMAISAVSLVVFALMPTASPWTLSLLMAVCGSGIEAVEVAYFLLPMDILDVRDMHATGVGTMNAFGKLFATFQGVLFGMLMDAAGYSNAFLVTAGVCALAAFLVVPIGK